MVRSPILHYWCYLITNSPEFDPLAVSDKVPSCFPFIRSLLWCVLTNMWTSKSICSVALLRDRLTTQHTLLGELYGGSLGGKNILPLV